MVDIKTTDWKGLLPVIITGILGCSVLLTGIGTFFYDIYNKPNLRIIVNENIDNNPNKTSIIVYNEGRVPATNLKLIVTAPQVIKNYSTFSTENVNTTRTSPSQLNLFTSRLPQGGGAIIATNLTTGPRPLERIQNYSVSAPYDQEGLFSYGMRFITEPIPIQYTQDYEVRATYDQGSVYSKGEYSFYSEFTRIWANPAIMALAGAIGITVFLVLYLTRKKRRSRAFRYEYSKRIDMIMSESREDWTDLDLEHIYASLAYVVGKKSVQEEDIEFVRAYFSQQLATRFLHKIQKISTELAQNREWHAVAGKLSELNNLNEILTSWFMKGAFREQDIKMVREKLTEFYRIHSWIFQAIEFDDGLVLFGHNFGEAPGIVFADGAALKNRSWTDTRIDVESPHAQKISRISIIKGNGYEISLEINMNLKMNRDKA
jgi:hypothetical protein